MADKGKQRKILIAMDGSEYSEGALKCKYLKEIDFLARFFVTCLPPGYE